MVGKISKQALMHLPNLTNALNLHSLNQTQFSQNRVPDFIWKIKEDLWSNGVLSGQRNTLLFDVVYTGKLCTIICKLSIYWPRHRYIYSVARIIYCYI